MFRWYDLTLLDVLLEKKLSGERIFTSLFEKNNPERILAFLSDESTYLDEFRIGNSVPLVPFLSSGIKQLLK
jgi:lycopene beta-cyclase